MKTIRLKYPLRFDHFEIPAGVLIQIPADLAHTAVQRGIATMAEPERAVVEPQEIRTELAQARMGNAALRSRRRK
jgi:hypothetical protein